MLGLRHVLRRLHRDEFGAVLVYVTVALSVIFGFAALAVGLGLAFATRDRLQIAADAAAAAGSLRLPKEAEAIAQAVAVAQANMPTAGNGNVLISADVVAGFWDKDQPNRSLAFTAGATPLNALRVTTRRAEANENRLPSIFSNVLGLTPPDVSATAIALGKPSNCTMNGIIASNRSRAGNAGSYGAGLCIHGQNGVSIGSNNTFLEGTALSMGELAPGVQQGVNNKGVDDALADRRDRFAKYTSSKIMTELLTPISNASRGDDPEGFETLEIERINNASGNFDPQEGKLIVVDKAVNLKPTMHLSCNTVCAVYSKEKITVDSNSDLKNLWLMSETSIEIASNVRLGKSTYCDDGDGAVFLAAKEDVIMNPNMEINGLQVFAGRDMELRSAPTNSAAITIHAANDIHFVNAQRFRTCDKADHVVIGGDKTARIVY